MVNISVSNYIAKVSILFELTKHFVLNVVKDNPKCFPMLVIIELASLVKCFFKPNNVVLHELGKVFNLCPLAQIYAIHAVWKL